MPRHDGNHPQSPRRHHKPMNSGSKGKGHDRQLKLAKQSNGKAKKQAKPTRRPRNASE